jgi:hypothetical protein
MKNKKNIKSAHRVVRDMKACFRSFQLPITEAQPGGDYAFSCDFLSHISNENVCALAMVKYDRHHGYININISTGLVIPAERLTEVLKMINLLNGMTPIYQYSICPCCNEISVHVSLHIHDHQLSKDKFKRLISYLLEDTYNHFPLIAQVVAGGSSEDVFEWFINDHKHLISTESKLTAEMEDKILEDVKLMFADFDITINDNDRVSDGFIIQFAHPKEPGLFLRVGTILHGDNEIVALSMSPPSAVPDDKLDVMIALVNRINRLCSSDHIYISSQKKNVVLLKGVMLDNGSIDKEELKSAFGELLGNGFRLFPIINEQLTSDESPETLICKRFPCYTDKTTSH